MSMGSFSVTVEVENPFIKGNRGTVKSALVDTGSLLSWFPAQFLYALQIEPLREVDFRQADGTILRRWVGEARIRLGDSVTIDDVVFAEESDLTILGARTLEGLNVRVDPVSMTLEDRGPPPVVAAA